MKQLFFLSAFLFLLSLSSVSQNWKPLNITDKYNYKLGESEVITHTIFADSVLVINGDSVFYLNRIMTNCDTCANNQYNQFALKNQPQFLMRKMTKISDSLYFFQDTSQFCILPHKSLGETWLFDTTKNISAAITVVATAIIFGQTDSIKQINTYG